MRQQHSEECAIYTCGELRRINMTTLHSSTRVRLQPNSRSSSSSSRSTTTTTTTMSVNRTGHAAKATTPLFFLVLAVLLPVHATAFLVSPTGKSSLRRQHSLFTERTISPSPIGPTLRSIHARLSLPLPQLGSRYSCSSSSSTSSSRSKLSTGGASSEGRYQGESVLSMTSDGPTNEPTGDSSWDGVAAGLVSESESGYTRWPSSNRIAIGVLASAGALESAFLTYQKLRPGGLDLLCGASGGCADVLAGPYSYFLGIPLTVPGTIAYAFVAALALAPLLVDQNEAVDKWTRSFILMVTTAMGVFAAYLSSLLVFKIGYPCPWCITSAVLSVSMCGVAWMKKAVPEKTKAAVLGVCTSLITAFACLTIFVITEATLDLRQAEASPGELVGLELVAAPKADTESTPQALRVGKKLKAIDAKMYGAYWCTHCFHQKQMLGKEAMSKVKYIECSNRGENNQVDMCKAANIPGFPTWDIDGKLYPGEQTLEELEEILGLEPFNA